MSAQPGRRVLAFGSYDAAHHPRVRVLCEGFADRGDEVRECNVPLGIDTAGRLEMARRPWLAVRLVLRLVRVWAALWRRAATEPPPDVLLVGYLGHFDVHLARAARRRRGWSCVIVLDHLTGLEETVVDRDAGGRRWLRSVLRWLDTRALQAADLVLVDTAENAAALPPSCRDRAEVVPVGATRSWFHAPSTVPRPPVRVVFFGLYTPLQGTPTVGEAISLLADDDRIAFTMIGTGQDRAGVLASAAGGRVTWIDWVAADELPGLVNQHHVCLGIFGSGAKARRVVPNKVYQGAAAGCAIVTSATPCQLEALGDAGVFVPPADAEALATALGALADDADRLDELRALAHERARAAFGPERVVEGASRRIDRLLTERAGSVAA